MRGAHSDNCDWYTFTSDMTMNELDTLIPPQNEAVDDSTLEDNEKTRSLLSRAQTDLT